MLGMSQLFLRIGDIEKKVSTVESRYNIVKYEK